MKKNLSLFALASSALMSGLVSCGGQSSDPLKDYNGMVIAPKTQEKSEVQSVLTNLFTIDLAGAQEENNGNFIEGQTGQILVRVTPRVSGIQSYSLILKDFAYSDEAQVVDLGKGIFAIRWTPRQGIVASGRVGLNLQAKVQVIVNDKDGKYVGLASEEKSIFVNVSRLMNQPKILGQTDFSKGLDEGTEVQFSVDIDDPSSLNSNKIPEIQITPYIYSNTEAFRADASKYITLDYSKSVNPERLQKSSKWRFYFTMKPDSLPLNKDRKGKDDVNANNVDACFYMRAVSVVGTTSVQQQICTNMRYSAQAPDLKWLATLDTVKAKEAVVLKFEATVGNDLGELLLPTVEQLSVLKGTKAITCTNTDSSKSLQRVCEITWTPECTKKEQTIKLSLKATNTLNKKVKSQTIQQLIKLVSNAEACAAPAAGQTVAPAATQVGSK